MRRIVLAIGSIVAFAVPAGTHATTAIIHVPLRHLSRASTQSTNWSGYAAYNTTFTDVKASWLQPTATCPKSTHQYASFWVGIDGYKSNSVEQLGTDSDCVGVNHPSYYAWWEMYPNPSNTIAGFAVHAGDSMTAEVLRSGTSYTLRLTNNTTGQTFSTTQNYSGANSSAEWVAEAPSQCIVIVCRGLPLANFGTVTFTGASATSGGAAPISGYTNDAITMVTQTGTPRAVPSGLFSGGSSFSDTWKHS
jgi:peptidase A4-like protein